MLKTRVQNSKYNNRDSNKKSRFKNQNETLKKRKLI